MEPAFRILGPLEIALEGHVVSLGGRRERAILGILLLNVGEVVSVERLIDGVWGEARPTSAKHMVHEYVSRLRTALAEISPIATRPPGYMLGPAGLTLDAGQFAQLTGIARAAMREQRHDDALDSYNDAMELWRGDTLADLALEGQAQIAAVRLDQERRVVGEERVDCALELGQHLQLIAELEHRVEQEPLREHARAQLMLALYRAGRQAEALARYREGHALLVDQAGVEPGRELRELERAILVHDPALDLARAPQRSGSSASPTRRRRLPRLAGAGVLLAAAVCVLLLVVTRSGSGTPIDRVGPNSVGAIDPATNRIVDQLPVGTGPGRMTAAFASIWVVNAFDDTVSRINPTTGNVERVIPVDGDPTGIAFGDGFVWVACTGTRKVDRIDPRVDRVTQRTPVGNGPSGIAISPRAIWVTNRLDDTVTEIDPTTGKRRRTLDAGPSPSDIAYGFGSLWIADESSSTVTRLDPASGQRIRTVDVENGPESVTVGFGSVWVANSLDRSVSRIDPRRNAVTYTIAVGPGPLSVLASDHSLWVADSYGGKIVRIDPAKNTVARTIDVGGGPQALAAIDGRIWLSARDTAGVHRGGTLRLTDFDVPDSLDSGLGYANNAWSVLPDTGDGLVGFKRVGGLDGGTVVPDLATALPEPTDDGRTYTFQLRRGIRYSNGDPVRASDVRRALERWFRLGSTGVGYYDGILGADACSRSRCDLSRGVVTDDARGTVTIHLRAPDAELFYKLALPFAYPVPPEVPMARGVRLGVPGTGPYTIQSYRKGRLVLVRNRQFHQWSAAAQPDGYPDRIVWTFGGALGTQLTAVEHGASDVMGWPLPASRMHEVTTRYAAQLHVFPSAGTIAIFLNTRVAPFNSLDARKAFNLALDRQKAIAGFGGRYAAAVTCQILPAGMTGYEPYCPYTRHATPHGLWTAPDLARALKLVAASGTRGQKVVLLTGAKPLQQVIGKVGLAALEQLGYDASLVTLHGDAYWDTIYDSRSNIQAGFFGWTPDYPAASNFLSLVTCGAFVPGSESNANPSGICDTSIDKAVDHALARQTNDPGSAANATWAAVDRRVTDLAPWAPILNTRGAVVVSRRVGNVQSNPQWGVLADQMWVR